MKNLQRCTSCGRRRKPAHENRDAQGAPQIPSPWCRPPRKHRLYRPPQAVGIPLDVLMAAVWAAEGRQINGTPQAQTTEESSGRVSDVQVAQGERSEGSDEDCGSQAPPGSGIGRSPDGSAPAEAEATSTVATPELLEQPVEQAVEAGVDRGGEVPNGEGAGPGAEASPESGVQVLPVQGSEGGGE